MLSERLEEGRLRQLAEQGAQGRLMLAAGQLPRLAEVLPQGGLGTLTADLAFTRSVEGLPAVSMQVIGTLGMRCQRCLRGLKLPIDIGATLLVIEDDTSAGGLADPFDTVLLVDGVLDLARMIEDEVLAGLPVAPAHAETTECAAVQAVPGQEVAAERLSRPFANLAAIMGRGQNNAPG